VDHGVAAANWCAYFESVHVRAHDCFLDNETIPSATNVNDPVTSANVRRKYE